MSDVSGLWDRSFKEDIKSKVQSKINENIIALYTDYEGDYTKPYMFFIGYEVNSFENVEDDLVTKAIPESKYAVFKFLTANEKIQEKVIESWNFIWNSDLKRTYTGDFELYKTDSPETTEVEIYISIE